MNVSIKIHPYRFIEAKIKEKEITKVENPQLSPVSKNGQVFMDILHNKLLVKNKTISFGSNIQEDKTFKIKVHRLKKILIEKEINPECIKQLVNFMNEAWSKDFALNDFKSKVKGDFIQAWQPYLEGRGQITSKIEKFKKLNIKNPNDDFNKIQCLSTFTLDDFINKHSNTEKSNIKPEHLESMKELYSLYALRRELNIFSEDNFSLLEDKIKINLPYYKAIDEYKNVKAEIQKKRKEEINLYGLDGTTLDIVKKAKKDLGINFNIPNSSKVAIIIYDLFADYKKLGYQLPKTVNLLDFHGFLTNPKGLASYENKEISFNPYFLSKILSDGSPQSMSKFFTIFRDSLQHELVGHSMHEVNIGENKFNNDDFVKFTSLLDEGEQKFLKEFESLFIKGNNQNTDSENLSEIIHNLEQAKEFYENNPEDRKNFSYEQYKNVILPVYRKLQNINTLIDMSFTNDKENAAYSKTNVLELVAIAAEMSNTCQYVPAFERILNKIGMYPLQDREKFNNESAISKSLEYKNELLDNLINIRTKEGKPLFSGEAIAKIMEYISPEKQIILNEILESEKDGFSMMNDGDEIAEIIKNE
ncbi:MAG: hypothetical protein WCK67_08290 [bacterium]